MHYHFPTIVKGSGVFGAIDYKQGMNAAGKLNVVNPESKFLDQTIDPHDLDAFTIEPSINLPNNELLETSLSSHQVGLDLLVETGSDWLASTVKRWGAGYVESYLESQYKVQANNEEYNFYKDWPQAVESMRANGWSSHESRQLIIDAVTNYPRADRDLAIAIQAVSKTSWIDGTQKLELLRKIVTVCDADLHIALEDIGFATAALDSALWMTGKQKLEVLWRLIDVTGNKVGLRFHDLQASINLLDRMEGLDNAVKLDLVIAIRYPLGQSIVKTGTSQISGQRISWFVLEDKTNHNQTIVALDSNGNSISAAQRVGERASLQSQIDTMDNEQASSWQEILNIFDSRSGVFVDNIDYAYELMGKVAQSRFPYEVSVKLVFQKGTFGVYMQLGNQSSIGSDDVVTVDSFSPAAIHNHPWSNYAMVGDDRMFTLSNPDLMYFAESVKKCEELIKDGVFSDDVIIPKYRTANGVYSTAVISHLGAMQLEYSVNSKNIGQIHIKYSKTRSHLNPFPKKIQSSSLGAFKNLFNLPMIEVTFTCLEAHDLFEQTQIDTRFNGDGARVKVNFRFDNQDLGDPSIWKAAGI